MTTSAEPNISNRARKAELRKRLRRERRNLSAQERATADRKICANLQRLPAFQRARNIAAYLAFDGEPSLASVFADKRNVRKHFHVPVLRFHHMKFAPIRADHGLLKNSFGIAEPNHRARVQTGRLDIVLVPLVGFDENGNRLGMGGGYYDRHFGYLRARSSFVRPRLIGVAYEFQCAREVPQDVWDVPLWAIVTDEKFRRI